MRKLKFSIRTALIGMGILTAVFAVSLSCYRYYSGFYPISVYPATNISEPIVSVYMYSDKYPDSAIISKIQFAIWEDGTVLWRAGEDGLSPEMLTRKANPEEISQLFQTLSKERLLDPYMQRNHQSIFHDWYVIQIATTEGVIELSSWRKDAEENYNIIFNGELLHGSPATDPSKITWPYSYKRFIRNWNAIQETAQKLKGKNAVPYNGPLPKLTHRDD